MSITDFMDTRETRQTRTEIKGHMSKMVASAEEILCRVTEAEERREPQASTLKHPLVAALNIQMIRGTLSIYLKIEAELPEKHHKGMKAEVDRRVADIYKQYAKVIGYRTIQVTMEELLRNGFFDRQSMQMSSASHRLRYASPEVAGSGMAKGNLNVLENGITRAEEITKKICNKALPGLDRVKVYVLVTNDEASRQFLRADHLHKFEAPTGK
ncbi:MAG TPA: hypothetical protein VND15_01320 [Candidatus Acidoferrales bacterium]|nr:hypothetical protein [Candidatus Acidoferrales bacterium]